MIFQEECRRGTGWDKPLDNESKDAWRRWLKSLPHLKDIWIPRCYKFDIQDIMTDMMGLHHVAFVYDKAKLAP